MSILNEPMHRDCLIVAHGSRLETSNNEIRRLTASLRGLNNQFKNIDCAFLEIAEPSIQLGLQQSIELGANEIVVVPYFLSSGRHVITDIPEQVAEVRRHFPWVDIRITDHIGANSEMSHFLLAHLSKAISD